MPVYEINNPETKCCCFVYVEMPRKESHLFIDGAVSDINEMSRNILNCLLERQGVPVTRADLLALWENAVGINNVDQALLHLRQIPGFKTLIQKASKQGYLIRDYANNVKKRNEAFCICAICRRNPGSQAPMVPPPPSQAVSPASSLLPKIPVKWEDQGTKASPEEKQALKNQPGVFPHAVMGPRTRSSLDPLLAKIRTGRSDPAL